MMERYRQSGMVYAPVVCALVMPMHPRWSAYALIAWALFALSLWVSPAMERAAQPVWTKSFRFVTAGSLSLFALYVIGWMRSVDGAMATFQLEVKLAWLLMPLLFIPWFKRISADQSRLALARVEKAWLAGLVVFMAVAWGKALFLFATTGDLSAMRYAALAGPFHPTYIAWYFAWGLFLLPRHLSKERLGRAFLVFGAFSFTMGMLASKAGWICGGLVLFWILVRNRLVRLPATAAILLLVAGAWIGGGSRLAEMTSSLSSSAGAAAAETAPVSEPVELNVSAGSTGTRIQAWTSALELINEHPWGVGTGDAQSVLDERYRESGWGYAGEKHMNAHNAWLQMGVATGWPGVLVLTIWWGGLLVLAFHFKNEALAVIVLLAGVNGLFESIFELQQGVVPWMFWVVISTAACNQGRRDLFSRM